MQPQIVHETEVHRQHVRLKFPIQVEIDGIRYQVDDWSIGGFGVESVMTSRQPGERFSVRLIFQFEQFDLTMRLEARMVYADQDHGRFGCAFFGLSNEQAGVFRYLVDAYLSGEVISAGDILQLRSHDSNAQARLQAIYHPLTADEDWTGRLKRYGAPAAFGLAGLVLLLLVGLAIKDRYLTVTSTDAVVVAPTVPIRAPIVGRFVSALKTGDRVPVDALLGMIQGFDGTLVSLESPCDCVVLEQVGLNGQHYQVGEPLAVLIEAARPLLVRAQLPLEQVEGLGVGDRAEIHVAGRDEVLYGQIERIDLRPGLMALSDNQGARRLPQVIVRPDQPFELEDFGALVSLRFP
ncbi:MAG TPA: PilZ domain-containing protein [Geminicoccaceae bacterium]|nr:PilZ domain-containing protein [Geminicoccaceae bacterium]